MNSIFIEFIILASPVPLPSEGSLLSQQLLDDAQDFLDDLGLILPMGYSPDMMKEDSSPLWTPSPLSFLPQVKAPLWVPTHLSQALITLEIGLVFVPIIAFVIWMTWFGSRNLSLVPTRLSQIPPESLQQWERLSPPTRSSLPLSP